MKNNLLVITDWFSDQEKYRCHFVKEYVNLVKGKFNNVYVISPQPYLPKFFLKLNFFSNYKNFTNFINYNYDNVYVYYPSFFTLPLKYISKFNWIFFYKKVLQIILKHSLTFDLIHTHFINTAGFAWAKIKQLNIEKRLIVHIHESPIENITDSIWFNKQKIFFIFNKADILISVWNKTKKYIDQFYWWNKKNKLISNFVNTNNFNLLDKWELRYKYWFKKEDKIIINVWNILFSHKWQDKLVEIIRKLIENNINIKLIIIWKWQDEKKLQEKIFENNLSKNIFYYWPINNKKLVDYYNLSDLFVSPSNHESFWIVQIEAMSCWLPVIAFKNWWSEDIIVDNKLWFLIDKIDYWLLCKKICLWLNKKYNKKYIRDYVINSFWHNIIKERLLKLYFKNY